MSFSVGSIAYVLRSSRVSKRKQKKKSLCYVCTVSLCTCFTWCFTCLSFITPFRETFLSTSANTAMIEAEVHGNKASESASVTPSRTATHTTFFHLHDKQPRKQTELALCISRGLQALRTCSFLFSSACALVSFFFSFTSFPFFEGFT